MNMQELIAAKQKQIKARQASSQRTSKLGDGKNILRILPTWRTEGAAEFWHDYGIHWVKDNTGKPHAYICTQKTFGDDCEICNTIGRAVASSVDDKQIARLKDCNAGQRYLVNAMNVGEKKTEVELFELPSSVFNAILDLMAEWGDVTDWDEGRALIINREGTGLTTKYTVTPHPKAFPVNKDKAEELFDLDAYVANVDESRMKELVSMVAGIGGIHAAKALPGSAEDAKFSSPSGEDIDDADFSEVFDDVPDSVMGGGASKASDADLDDLDDLLDDIEGM